jgi:hypothetical protein
MNALRWRLSFQASKVSKPLKTLWNEYFAVRASSLRILTVRILSLIQTDNIIGTNS